MSNEISVSPNAPMPPGYSFLPKGIAYKTLHCRKLTHASGKPLYVVMDNKKTQGLRAPKNIIAQVHSQAKATLSTRRAATQERDACGIAKAAACLEKQFPKMPAFERDLVLKHGFKKHSGRVGRAGSIPLEKKALLAVIAHVRHRHSDYDARLRAGEERDIARKATRQAIEGVLRKWGFTEDLGDKKTGPIRKTKTTKTKTQAQAQPHIKTKTKRKARKRSPSMMDDFDLIADDDSMDGDYVP